MKAAAKDNINAGHTVLAFTLLTAAASVAWSQPGTITTFAGAAPEGLGGPAPLATLRGGPSHLAQDNSGNLYIVGLAAVYRVSPDGTISLIAGDGIRGSTGDGGPALQARLNCGFLSGIVVDSAGNVIVSETLGHRIRLISPDGRIRTIAGTGTANFAGDGGQAVAAQLFSPAGLALDSNGNLYVADSNNRRVRQISSSGIITTVAGNGNSGGTGDGGAATQASFVSPVDVAVDSSGDLYVADSLGQRVRRIGPDGTIATVAGVGQPNSQVSDTQGNAIMWTDITALALDRSGNLFITASNHIVKLDLTGKITVVAGDGSVRQDDYQGPALGASIVTANSLGLLVDQQGNLLVAISSAGRIAKIDPSGRFSFIVGANFTGAGASVAYSAVPLPSGLAFDPAGAFYIRNYGPPLIQKVVPGGVLPIFDNLFGDGSIVADAQQNLYVSDRSAHTILKIDIAGKISTFAGASPPYGVTAGFSGDGGPAVQASINLPGEMAFDVAGAMYFVDGGNNRVRKVAPDGAISTVAGTGVAGFAGDHGPAIAAQFNAPYGLVFDQAGNLYIGDANNNRIRKITPQGTITTFAGTGVSGFSGDGGPAVQANVSFPRSLAIDANGNLYFTQGALRVRKITPAGIVSTVAGNGANGFSGDGGPATSAALNNIKSIAVDANGNLYIADQDNRRVRKVQGTAPFNVAPLSLLVSVALGSPAVNQTVTLASSDGASRQYQATSSAPWLTVTPASGAVSSAASAPLTITFNPSGLKKGTYSGSLTVLDPLAGSATQIPVTLTVSGTAQQLRLSQVGVTFTAIQGGASPAPQALQVLNTGTGSMPWTAKAATLSGSNWLSVSPSSGATVVGATAPSLTITVNVAGLPAGSYYGQVDVAAPSADNSPQSAVVLLNILPTDGTPGPQLNPSGLLFTAIPGATPAAQNVELFNPATHTSNYTAAVRFTNGAGWLTAPAAGALTAGQRLTLAIQPRATALAAGVYRATVTFTVTPENVTRALDIALVVNAAATASAAKAAAGVTCAAKQLVAVLRRPGASYQTAAGWPIPIEAAVVDDCGAPLTDGKVTTSFSTNDPTLALLHTGNGIWQATWASRNTTSAVATLTIKVQAESRDQTLTGQTQVAIRSDLNPNQPSIAPGGVVNAASFHGDTPVSPGEYVSVFGLRLAQSFQAAGSLPLPTTLGDTVVAVGGAVAPLHFASDGQVNAILPYGIPDSTTLQIIVRRGNVLSIPEPLLIGATQPAVFTIDGTGTGQGHIYGATAQGTLLADSNHPVRAGDTLVILATGLGAVNPPVREGEAAPSDPPSLAVSPIELTIQGKKAQIVFAGLAPGFAGVFQLNAIVPPDVTADPAAPLIVSAGGQPSPPVTLAITN